MASINKRYLIVRNMEEKTIKYLEYDPNEGYQIYPKGNVRFEDAINVDKMVLISPTLISKMINKKASKRINYLLKLLNFIDNNEEEAPDALDLALDEVYKFRQEIINKYHRHLNEEEEMILNNKISIIEDELKLRKNYILRERLMSEEFNRSR